MGLAEGKRIWVAAAICLGLSGAIAAAEPDYAAARKAMVAILRQQGIRDERVLGAMGTVPRHLFSPHEYRGRAYADTEIPLGGARMMNKPYVVALMTQTLQLKPGARVLEVGTGAGYHTALLAELSGRVVTIDRQKSLADAAAQRVRSLGYKNVRFLVGEESKGWAAGAPYDAILVTSAAESVPTGLLGQLADGGCLVIPIGRRTDRLELTLDRIRRKGDLVRSEAVIPLSMSGSPERPPRPRGRSPRP